MRRKIPEILTLEEQEMLLNVFNKRYYTSRRNKCMINLFLATGLRVSELSSLKWEDVNLHSGQIKVVDGKGSKDRILWMNHNMLQELRNWKEDQDKKARSNYVFSTGQGNKLNDRDIREMLNIYSKKSIGKRISPHTLRHTFATDLYRETKDIRLVQKALGHSDLSTTMIYTHIVDDELEQSLKLFRQK